MTTQERASVLDFADDECPGGLECCDGVRFKPGDIIVGDGDGIVVVPREWAEGGAKKAEAKEKLEALSRKLILEGKPLEECYPRLKKEHVVRHGLEKYWEIVYPDHES